MWGRAIGLVYFIPAAIFWRFGWFTSPMKKRIGLAGGLLLFQVQLIVLGIRPVKHLFYLHFRDYSDGIW